MARLGFSCLALGRNAFRAVVAICIADFVPRMTSAPMQQAVGTNAFDAGARKVTSAPIIAAILV
jgi:hypothetical protein